MLSPGVVRNVKEVLSIFERPVINVPQYILGDVSQNLRSRPDAFNREKWHLEALNWPEDGYAIFDFAVLPGERPMRTFFGAIESNCLIATKTVFEDCGTFDERFDEPSGGFANLELFSRLTTHPENTYIMLPGEGSFHQDHHGTTTGRSPETRDQAVAKFRKKYKQVTGFDVLLNPRSPFLYGEMRQSTHGIPTISREFGKVRQKILDDLADIYVARGKAGIEEDNHPVLASSATPLERRAFKQLPPLGLLDSEVRFSGKKFADINYKMMLQKLHENLKPNLYFEIGVDSGSSMELSTCMSVGIDPEYHITRSITAPCRLFRITSDGFFEDESRCEELLSQGIDLGFIDGMHLSEYVLRDFINVERWSKAGGTIVFDDVLPEQMIMAHRERDYNAWCGDVYKIIPILRKYRPDLKIDVFEAFIGPYRKGVAVVRNLDPANDELSKHYDRIVSDINAGIYSANSVEDLEQRVGGTEFTDFEEYVASLIGKPQPVAAV
ncbi:MAG: class I SAM-dependent methyltransferase [Pseudomonadota bacterium]